MAEKHELIKIDDPKSLMGFLQAPTLKIAETLTGILASDTKDIKLFAGKLIQASIKGSLLTQLGKEIETLRKKGAIKEDFFQSRTNQACFKELLGFIDDEVPDEDRFNAMKALFFSAISGDSSTEKEILAYELMQVCKKLKAGDLLVLKANFDVAENRSIRNLSKEDIQNAHSSSQWLDVISEQIGHKIRSLVEVHEANLIELKLITRRTYDDLSGFPKTDHFRLTDLGYQLCQHIIR